MGRIIVGTIVGTIIFFMLQTLAWVGGIHKDMWQYSPKQDSLFEQIKATNLPEGLYMFPAAEPSMDQKKKEEVWKANMGKPWAMLFYHPSMQGENAATIIKGALHDLLICLIVCMVIFHGHFRSFFGRFLVGWSFGIFATIVGPMAYLNWWSFPWSFVQAEVIDLLVLWGITCIWFAIYVKHKAPKTT